MFLLIKLFSRLLFPVAVVIELFTTGLILVKAKRRRAGYCFCIAGLVLLVTISMNPIADLFLWTLEGRYLPLQHATPELKEKIKYIVVLGGGHSERKVLSVTARLNPFSTGRVTEAVRLSRELPGIPVIFTGGVIRGTNAAGDVNSRAAVAYGLSSSRVIVDRSALNTFEEARVVSSIVGDSTVLLVTSASHMRRAVGLFKTAGIRTVPAPSDYQAEGGPYSPWSNIPSAYALYKIERAWYEYLGLAWNAVQGK